MIDDTHNSYGRYAAIEKLNRQREYEKIIRDGPSEQVKQIGAAPGYRNTSLCQKTCDNCQHGCRNKRNWCQNWRKK